MHLRGTSKTLSDKDKQGEKITSKLTKSIGTDDEKLSAMVNTQSKVDVGAIRRKNGRVNVPMRNIYRSVDVDNALVNIY